MAADIKAKIEEWTEMLRKGSERLAKMRQETAVLEANLLKIEGAIAGARELSAPEKPADGAK